MTARFLIFCLLVLQLTGGVAVAEPQGPFSSGDPDDRVTATSPPRSSFLTKIALYQQRLKQTMATLIRQVKTSGSIYPLLVLLAIAFGYGVVHAAGPGHGKMVAMSYMMSRTPSIAGGLLLGSGIALFHGFSGAICVLGLHYVLQKSISGTLATITYMTQIVSFGLIMLLGIGIAARRGWKLFFREDSRGFPSDTKTRGLLPWAVAVGVVPCPGVVMVMLFCLSMDVLILGLLLAVCISVGMATTISLVAITVAMGKAGILSATSTRHAETLEGVVGILSGIVIASLGTLFLLATIHSA